MKETYLNSSVSFLKTTTTHYYENALKYNILMHFSGLDFK